MYNLLTRNHEVQEVQGPALTSCFVRLCVMEGAGFGMCGQGWHNMRSWWCAFIARPVLPKQRWPPSFSTSVSMMQISMMHVSKMQVIVMHVSMMHISMMHVSMMHVSIMHVSIMLDPWPWCMYLWCMCDVYIYDPQCMHDACVLDAWCLYTQYVYAWCMYAGTYEACIYNAYMCDAHQKWRRTDKNMNSWSRRTNTIDHVNRWWQYQPGPLAGGPTSERSGMLAKRNF